MTCRGLATSPTEIRPDLDELLALFLMQTMERGWRARVVRSSSVGCEVPEDIVPPSARLDGPEFRLAAQGG
jgi:hypothetical protein